MRSRAPEQDFRASAPDLLEERERCLHRLRDGGIRARLEAHELAAREHGGGQRARRRKHEDHHGVAPAAPPGSSGRPAGASSVIRSASSRTKTLRAAMAGRSEAWRSSSRIVLDADERGPLRIPLGRRRHDHVQIGMLAARRRAGNRGRRPHACRLAHRSAPGERERGRRPSAARAARRTRRRAATRPPRARARAARRARGWSAIVKRHAGTPRRSPCTSRADLRRRPRGVDDPHALGLGALDLEIAAAHPAMKGQRLALEVIEAAAADAAEAHRGVQVEEQREVGQHAARGAARSARGSSRDRRPARSPGRRRWRRCSDRRGRRARARATGGSSRRRADGARPGRGTSRRAAGESARRAGARPRRARCRRARASARRDSPRSRSQRPSRAIWVVLPDPSTPSNVMSTPRDASSQPVMPEDRLPHAGDLPAHVVSHGLLDLLGDRGRLVEEVPRAEAGRAGVGRVRRGQLVRAARCR